MGLHNREIGALFSQVEWNLTFNDKYSDTGYVHYIGNNSRYFELRPSPFLENKKSSIYCSGDIAPPPNETFIKTNVIKEDKIEAIRKGPIRSIKTIDKWESFDPTPLAERRKSMNPEEIIDFFSKKYKGEEDLINEIATCSSLYSFSSPPYSLDYGGINAGAFGRKDQWDNFKFPFRVIPPEFKRKDSAYYYYIAEKERKMGSIKNKEISLAFFRPEKTDIHIPIVLDGTYEKKISKEYREALNESSEIIYTSLLDSLLLTPKPSKNVVSVLADTVYELIDDYKKGGNIAYNQNLGDALPKLSSAYARLFHNSDINHDVIKNVFDLWADMHHRTIKLYRAPSKISDMYVLSGDARKLYIDLHEIYGVDYNISLKEAFEATSLDYEDFTISIDSLSRNGLCIRYRDSIRLVDL
jgi:hypothetical protein